MAIRLELTDEESGALVSVLDDTLDDARCTVNDALNEMPGCELDADGLQEARDWEALVQGMRTKLAHATAVTP